MLRCEPRSGTTKNCLDDCSEIALSATSEDVAQRQGVRYCIALCLWVVRQRSVDLSTELVGASGDTVNMLIS